ncbi:MAG: hypothetical protein JXA44_01470 [Methanospirillaceae archaeon]|nr:hypothetical protein [Methanospirillaceae archaeon]
MPRYFLNLPGRNTGDVLEDALSWNEIAQRQSDLIDLYSSQAKKAQESQTNWQSSKKMIDTVKVIACIGGVASVAESPDAAFSVGDIVSTASEQSDLSPEIETVREAAEILGIVGKAYVYGSTAAIPDMIIKSTENFVDYKIRDVSREEKYLIYQAVIAKDMELTARKIDTLTRKNEPSSNDMIEFIKAASTFADLQAEVLELQSAYESHGKSIALSEDDQKEIQKIQDNLKYLKQINNVEESFELFPADRLPENGYFTGPYRKKETGVVVGIDVTSEKAPEQKEIPTSQNQGVWGSEPDWFVGEFL